jgi:hypothetical protein
LASCWNRQGLRSRSWSSITPRDLQKISRFWIIDDIAAHSVDNGPIPSSGLTGHGTSAAKWLYSPVTGKWVAETSQISISHPKGTFPAPNAAELQCVYAGGASPLKKWGVHCEMNPAPRPFHRYRLFLIRQNHNLTSDRLTHSAQPSEFHKRVCHKSWPVLVLLVRRGYEILLA